MLKFLRTRVGLEHIQQARTFLIGDIVKCIFDVVVRENFLPHLSRTDQFIGIHSALVIVQFVDVHFPFGAVFIHNFVGHPGGKSFIQPGVIPPRHRDQVAEPLMGQLGP